MKTDKEFLEWFINRLVYYHKYPIDGEIVNKLQEITKKIDVNVDDDELDRILAKYYVDFKLDGNTELGFGFTEE